MGKQKVFPTFDYDHNSLQKINITSFLSKVSLLANGLVMINFTRNPNSAIENAELAKNLLSINYYSRESRIVVK